MPYAGTPVEKSETPVEKSGTQLRDTLNKPEDDVKRKYCLDILKQKGVDVSDLDIARSTTFPGTLVTIPIYLNSHRYILIQL